ncbi:MAG: ATPase, T2SS/T4P/T4SS family [Candidatus Altiarchaeota archaeon]|nr:ATPase, T2SS/T4P/T4SS family [Candidatus Altiarchaeota archaeon]
MAEEIIDSYDSVKIVHRGHDILPEYRLIYPEMSESEKLILKDPSAVVKNYKDLMRSVDAIQSPSEKEAYIKSYLETQLREKGVSPANETYIIENILDNMFLGYGRIGPMMRDEQLEEIMINGVGRRIFVVHRKHGMCESNLLFEEKESLMAIIKWLSNYVQREISETSPLLDAQMPDGSRANIAVQPAAPYGPAITIRKFKKVPYNVIDLIKIGSLTPELASFLWLCIEGLGIHPINMLVSGGAGSGKTTLMNALAMFIPQTERIVTVEDTLELNFDFMDNWVPMEAMPSVLEASRSRLDMDMLLKNALRMRPDRVIVGEVRGEEAQTLMVAMDIGMRGSMGTIHANNARDTTLRLLDQPMAVPLRMMPLINVIVVMNRIYDRRRGMIRRVTQVSEISGIEGEVVQIGDIYTWNMNLDKISRTEFPVMLIDKLAERCNIPKKRIQTELLVREKVLQYMVNNNITGNDEVVSMLHKYHVDPQLVIDDIRNRTGGAAIPPTIPPAKS